MTKIDIGSTSGVTVTATCNLCIKVIVGLTAGRVAISSNNSLTKQHNLVPNKERLPSQSQQSGNRMSVVTPTMRHRLTGLPVFSMTRRRIRAPA